MPKNVGLRFRASDEPKLRTIVHRIRTGDFASRAERGQAVGLFEAAANAAQTGEPLLLVGADPQDAIVIADGFPRWGVSRPAVEVLTD